MTKRWMMRLMMEKKEKEGFHVFFFVDLDIVSLYPLTLDPYGFNFFLWSVVISHLLVKLVVRQSGKLYDCMK
ncbi:hypothetical protein QBC45DRAFT_186181 [Copromyces sp. CBS 386.78]|nr:hypothetical protein QBC45DRAFT_186181 [Copromyces sp. CBS 386.78]